MGTLEKAIGIAAKAHTGQTRKNGEPYVMHPLRVMLSAGDPFDETVMIVAVLHDVIEDTSWTPADLRREGFGDEVLEPLRLLTHDKADSYDRYISAIKADPVARRVKLADLADNMNPETLPAITARDKERMAKYRKAREVLSGNCPSPSVPTDQAGAVSPT